MSLIKYIVIYKEKLYWKSDTLHLTKHYKLAVNNQAKRKLYLLQIPQKTEHLKYPYSFIRLDSIIHSKQTPPTKILFTR